MRNATHQSIRKTMAAAGLPIGPKSDDNCEEEDSGDISIWNLTDDGSIVPPSGDGYGWVGVEIVSPAYEFTPENLQAVEKLCEVTTSNYLTQTSADSTGLHVHVSFGVDKKWSYDSIKRALMFFWSFHTQFDSLHPRNRQDRYWAKSMRTSSKMQTDHRATKKALTPLEGLLQIESYTNMEDLLTAVSGNSVGPDRLMAYNTLPIYSTRNSDMSNMHARATFEFRQHEGTLEGERVTQWIKVLCKVIIFLENVQQVSLMELLNVLKEEEWVKTGIEKADRRTERKLGPVLAEGRFTIIDLLEHMGLQKSADFYRTRLHKLKTISFT
jgi:hypothetical protein